MATDWAVVEDGESWGIRLHRRVRYALPVSAKAVLDFRRDVEVPARRQQALERLWWLAFPPRLSDWWLGSVRRFLLTLRPPDQAKVLTSFFGWRGAGNRW